QHVRRTDPGASGPRASPIRFPAQRAARETMSPDPYRSANGTCLPAAGDGGHEAAASSHAFEPAAPELRGAQAARLPRGMALRGLAACALLLAAVLFVALDRHDEARRANARAAAAELRLLTQRLAAHAPRAAAGEAHARQVLEAVGEDLTRALAHAGNDARMHGSLSLARFRDRALALQAHLQRLRAQST